MKILTQSLILTFGMSFIVACSDAPDQTGEMSKNETALEHAEKHLDPTYVCPMHPNIIQTEPGNCPICGMDLVKQEAEEVADTAEAKILYYRHPHNPSITSDKPMKDEMGMDYVAVYDDGGGAAVKISPAVVNNMGVRTTIAEYNKLWRRVDTVGYVGFDENKISHIHLRTKGWIDKLKIKSEGERVKKGQLLFEVYAPELVTAQEEYLQAMGVRNRQLLSASKERLVALGISERQIKELKKTRKVKQYVQVYAPQDGIIDKLNVREGMFVMPQKEIMALADLSSVWILAEVFEKQTDWIKEGQSADVRLSYLPGRTWEGKVEYIYPSLNPKTRTLKVRLRFDNADESLKPNMFANVTIFAGPKSEIIVIPREALIRTGEEQRVILDMGEGRYQPRNVVAGIESGDWVEIQNGLEEGDKVVTSGQFLIDSEASLKASLKRMQSPKAMDKEQSTKTQPSPSKQVRAMGTLRKVIPEKNVVNISHDPIEALGWPSMTMDLDVSPDIDLKGFKPDDMVTFELKEGKDGYVITSMQVHDMGGR